jgi:predicted dehydrogenase
MWDYGTGELGNNGIHTLDRIRWLLNLEAPVRITAGGGKLFYDDDQETPDTLTATYDFPHCSVTWEHRVWSREKSREGLVLYGDHRQQVFLGVIVSRLAPGARHRLGPHRAATAGAALDEHHLERLTIGPQDQVEHPIRG